MSSSRANAAARARRAGGDMPPPMQQQQMNGRPGQQQQGQGHGQAPPPGGNVKMSISDAIALITLRLGRVEQIVQNMPVDGVQGNLGDNTRIVDDTVLVNIVQRLEALEKSQKSLVDKVSKTPAPVVVPPVAPVQSQSVDIEAIEVLHAELAQVKELLMHLQSFTMQTNQRLADIVFSENGNGNGNGNEQVEDNNIIVSESILDTIVPNEIKVETVEEESVEVANE